MATLSGGGTIASVGLTAQENQQISQILQTSFTSTTSATQVVVTDTSSTLTTTPSVVTVGTFTTNTVLNQSVSGGSSDLSQVSISTGTPGSVTNVIADSGVKGLVITGTQANTVVGVLGGANTSMIVGDAGTQFIDNSRSTVGATIVSGVGNDSVIGGSGNDQVQLGDFGVANGGSGADTLIGGLGAATLGGGGGADSIVASSGGGVLIGETGNDTMVAGAGKDVFIYTSGGGNDVISGFDPTQDTLALANFTDISAAGLSLTDIISRATVVGGSTVITMPDGSSVTVSGVTGINVNWFTIK